MTAWHLRHKSLPWFCMCDFLFIHPSLSLFLPPVTFSAFTTSERRVNHMACDSLLLEQGWANFGMVLKKKKILVVITRRRRTKAKSLNHKTYARSFLCGSWLLIRLITKATIGVLEKQNTMFCFYGNVVFYMQTLLNQTMMPSATLQPNTLLAIPTWAWDKS